MYKLFYRLLLPTPAGQSALAAALLHALEGLPVHAVGLPSLISDVGSRSLEEALVHAFIEAQRAAPAILYLPHLGVWWATAPAALRATLMSLLGDLPAELPLLLLATAEEGFEEVEAGVRRCVAASAVRKENTQLFT